MQPRLDSGDIGGWRNHWVTGQAREASWKQVWLGLGHRSKSGLKGLNKKPGLRRCGGPKGKHPQGTQKPGAPLEARKQGAQSHSPSTSRNRGSSVPAWGLQRAVCSLSVWWRRDFCYHKQCYSKPSPTCLLMHVWRCFRSGNAEYEVFTASPLLCKRF